MPRNVKACPLCKGQGPLLEPDQRTGHKGWLYWGTTSGDSAGVECHRCGLKLTLRMPVIWPRNMPKGLQGMKAIAWLHNQVLKAAVRKWNRLPRREP